MKKTTHKPILFPTIILIVTFLLGYYSSGFLPVQEKDKKNEGNPVVLTSEVDIISQERDKGVYQFINPLLECEVNNSFSQQKYLPFEAELKNSINTTILERNPNIHVSIYFRNLNNGPWFGINEREDFAPASLMKIPITMAYMKWAEIDSTILKKELSVIRENESIQNFEPGNILDDTRTYTVIELIERSLKLSDNDANRTLLNNISDDFIMKIFGDLGLPILDKLQSGVEDYITVKQYASFFRILYNASYLERSSSENLLGILSDSHYTNGIRKYIPEDIVISHKFGERRYTDEKGSEITQLHDCGIVYYTKYPYLLCVMTKGTSTEFSTLESIIQDTSRLIFETIQSKYP
ncbi:serine hydrolase [Candidatus Gracilibacteria bacterium]|nr:serine hydrolase [Candidatus Gracilibacteria bacterium]